jgi:hypothetical protein
LRIHSQAEEYVGEVGANKCLNIRAVSRPRQKTHGILTRMEKQGKLENTSATTGTFVRGLGRAKFQVIRGSEETKYSSQEVRVKIETKLARRICGV